MVAGEPTSHRPNQPAVLPQAPVDGQRVTCRDSFQEGWLRVHALPTSSPNVQMATARLSPGCVNEGNCRLAMPMRPDGGRPGVFRYQEAAPLRDGKGLGLLVRRIPRPRHIPRPLLHQHAVLDHPCQHVNKAVRLARRRGSWRSLQPAPPNLAENQHGDTSAVLFQHVHDAPVVLLVRRKDRLGLLLRAWWPGPDGIGAVAAEVPEPVQQRTFIPGSRRRPIGHLPVDLQCHDLPRRHQRREEVLEGVWWEADESAEAVKGNARSHAGTRRLADGTTSCRSCPAGVRLQRRSSPCATATWFPIGLGPLGRARSGWHPRPHKAGGIAPGRSRDWGCCPAR